LRFIRLKVIVRKEFYHLIRDYRSLYLAFAIPLLLIILFGYALSFDVDNVGTVFVDHDKTELSHDFIRKLDASSYFNVTESLPRTRDAVDYLDHDKAKVAIVIPSDFMKSITADREIQLQVIIDASDPTSGNIILGYITSFIKQYNQQILVDFLNREGRDELNQPVDGRIRIWFNEDLESRNFIIPGIIAVIIMIVGAILTSLVIAREYENGTMETIKSMPVRAGELLLGKTIPYIILSLFQLFAVTAVAVYWFEIPFKGSLLLLFVATCLFMLSAMGIGLFISTIAATKQQAMMTAFFFVLPFFMLSGFIFPIANMPEAVQWLTYLNPLRFFLVIIRDIFLKGVGFDVLWPQCLALTILGAIVFTGAISRSKKRLD